MNFSSWSIRHPIPPIALFVVLTVLGVFAFIRLPVTQFPNIDFPIIRISIAQPGAAPMELTNQVVKPIENSVWDLNAIRHVTALANDGAATITVEFEIGTDTDRALNDVKDSVESIRSDLPESITEPVIERVDVTGSPILTYAVFDRSRSVGELSYFIDDVVSRQLQAADGVGDVSRIGGAESEIKVELDPDRLLALGITASQVNDQLNAKNTDLGGGRGDVASQEYSIRVLGAAPTIGQLRSTEISLPAGNTVRLEQLGTVTMGTAAERNFAMLDGQPVVAFGVFRQTGASDLVAADNAKKILKEIESEYPDTTFTQIDDLTNYTQGSFESAMDTLYEGAALAVIVVFLFLRNWRATLITALALPLSIIPTFFVMQMLGFSLNTVSLLGITLVTGILVDDAIVEIENIVRHARMGRPPYEASMEAAREIGLTVVAISLTIVAVFAPVSFMGGIAGQYFRQFGLTVAVAVLFSLAVARLITPMVSAYFMRDKAEDKREDGFLMRRYQAILAWTLQHRTITLIAGFIIFAGSIYSATLLPTEFIPAADVGRSVLSVELPPGARLEDTRRATRKLTSLIENIPEVESVFVDGGSGGINEANLTIDFGPKEDRERGFRDIEGDIRAAVHDVPDMRLHLLNENQSRDLTIDVLGDTRPAAQAAAGKLLNEMHGVDLIRDPSTSATLAQPEVRITPHPKLSAQLGVTASAIAATARIATIGATEANLAKFDTGERRIPILVLLNEQARNNLTMVRTQRVPSESGKQIALETVADIRLASGPSTIERYDRKFRVSLAADLVDGEPLGPALAAVRDLPTAKHMPAGTSIQPSGNTEAFGEIFDSFAMAMTAGILLVYTVLVLLFSSFLVPLSILLSLPLAIGGAIFALLLSGSAIGLSVVIGFLMLMGIVTKNAIMLVEFAHESVKDGTSTQDAMLDAGHKRVRPILMTTVAMAAGMVPSALVTGTGGEFRSPMAIAVIGGLLLSTVLSLLFVPSLYSVIEAGSERLTSFLSSQLGMNRPSRIEERDGR